MRVPFLYGVAICADQRLYICEPSYLHQLKELLCKVEVDKLGIAWPHISILPRNAWCSMAHSNSCQWIGSCVERGVPKFWFVISAFNSVVIDEMLLTISPDTVLWTCLNIVDASSTTDFSCEKVLVSMDLKKGGLNLFDSCSGFHLQNVTLTSLVTPKSCFENHVCSVCANDTKPAHFLPNLVQVEDSTAVPSFDMMLSIVKNIASFELEVQNFPHILPVPRESDCHSSPVPNVSDFVQAAFDMNADSLDDQHPAECTSIHGVVIKEEFVYSPTLDIREELENKGVFGSNEEEALGTDAWPEALLMVDPLSSLGGSEVYTGTEGDVEDADVELYETLSRKKFLLCCTECDKTFKGGLNRIPCLIKHAQHKHGLSVQDILSLLPKAYSFHYRRCNMGL